MNLLTTEAGRKEALKLLQSELIKKLHSLNIGFVKDLHCRIETSFVEVGIIEETEFGIRFKFASEVTIHTAVERFGRVQVEEINFCSSGSFSPDNEASYWRTIHAAIILQNWEVLMPIFKDFCERYTILINEIQNANQ